MTETKSMHERTASCGCGNLKVTARGEPSEVYVCSCLNCQRESGSAFSYGAIYPEAAVSIAGERKVWRRHADSGRWLETEFCPTCGVTVSLRMEAAPETIGVPVGCFADPNFAKLDSHDWASRRHRWLQFPDDIKSEETQPD